VESSTAGFFAYSKVGCKQDCKQDCKMLNSGQKRTTAGRAAEEAGILQTRDTLATASILKHLH
jgi:hypothetical protein